MGGATRLDYPTPCDTLRCLQARIQIDRRLGNFNNHHMTSSEPFIQFRSVRKAFGPKVVYSGLDLSVQRGAALCIVGGSGVGKSVMLKMLIGLLRPDAGSIRFDAAEVTRMSSRELSLLRQRIAMLFQA